MSDLPNPQKKLVEEIKFIFKKYSIYIIFLLFILTPFIYILWKNILFFCSDNFAFYDKDYITTINTFGNYIINTIVIFFGAYGIYTTHKKLSQSDNSLEQTREQIEILKSNQKFDNLLKTIELLSTDKSRSQNLIGLKYLNEISKEHNDFNIIILEALSTFVQEKWKKNDNHIKIAFDIINKIISSIKKPETIDLNFKRVTTEIISIDNIDNAESQGYFKYDFENCNIDQISLNKCNTNLIIGLQNCVINGNIESTGNRNIAFEIEGSIITEFRVKDNYKHNSLELNNSFIQLSEIYDSIRSRSFNINRSIIVYNNEKDINETIVINKFKSFYHIEESFIIINHKIYYIENECNETDLKNLEDSQFVVLKELHTKFKSVSNSRLNAEYKCSKPWPKSVITKISDFI